MYLLEHDAKTLLEKAAVPVPRGLLLQGEDDGRGRLAEGAWVVKGQVAAGGRGKGGLVKKAGTADEALRLAGGMMGAAFKGRRVQAVRIEEQVSGAAEVYISLMINAAAGGIQVILSEQGGMEIESVPADQLLSETVSADAAAVVACVDRLVRAMPARKAAALAEAARKLAGLFFEYEAVLVEINPLFVMEDGWVAGDAKIVTDDNALDRQPWLRQLLEDRAGAYPETVLKRQHGFDYVVVDPEGDIGLLTTGAGLSMMLIDELRADGLKPYNFLDIRTGGFRGDPSRLVSVLSWFGEAPSLKAVLINVFAGVTDLGEFSALFVEALKRAPSLRVPMVARLVGNNQEAAQRILGQSGIPLYTDLKPATDHLRKLLATC